MATEKLFCKYCENFIPEPDRSSKKFCSDKCRLYFWRAYGRYEKKRKRVIGQTVKLKPAAVARLSKETNFSTKKSDLPPFAFCKCHGVFNINCPKNKK